MGIYLQLMQNFENNCISTCSCFNSDKKRPILRNIDEYFVLCFFYIFVLHLR